MKSVHVLFVFIWVGQLLALTRLLGYQAKEELSVQIPLSKIFKRMYLFVELPAMILALLSGLYLLNNSFTQTFFLVKMSGVATLVACDLTTGYYIFQNLKNPRVSKGIQYKVLHGIAGLALIAIVVAIYVLKPR